LETELRGIPSFKCENQVKLWKRINTVNWAAASTLDISRQLSPCKENIAGMMKFIPILNLAIPA